MFIYLKCLYLTHVSRGIEKHRRAVMGQLNLIRNHTVTIATMVCVLSHYHLSVSHKLKLLINSLSFSLNYSH